MAFDFGNLLQQYLGGAQGGSQNPAQVESDFHQVAQNAPPDALGSGVAAALRSDQTPPFGQMIGQLFGNGNPQQRAGMLNQLVAGLSPALLGTLGAGLGRLGGGGDSHGGAGTSSPAAITPDQAQQIDPSQVQQIAEQAAQHDPSVIDRMGDFYSAHPTLVKTIGSAGLAIAMSKIAERMRS